MERPTLDNYGEWSRSTLNARFDQWEGMLYFTNTQSILNAAKNHEFFREMRSILGTAARDFEAETGTRLLAAPPVEPGINLQVKKYDSAVEKSFRLNVLRNKLFPNPPASGWITPPAWYTQLNDVVRGDLVCAYLDGLPWLAERLRSEAEKRALKLVFNSEQRDEGYYAFHVYATLPALRLQVRNADNSISEAAFDVAVEIQLTTHLQDALREVTHFFYEERRIHGLTADWKWQHDSPQFRASYISHSLHFLDAIIVELRKGVGKARKPVLLPSRAIQDADFSHILNPPPAEPNPDTAPSVGDPQPDSAAAAAATDQATDKSSP